MAHGGINLSPVARIPLVLLTGALGSGKTTLLRAALASAGGEETAVIVNEFGRIGIDQHLLWQGSDTVALLENGCICCAMRDDLGELLRQLFWRRLERSVPRFRRVVIETTGLADARNIRAALADDALVAERYAAPLVVTVVDGEVGPAGLARPEAGGQVEVADHLVISKADLAGDNDLLALKMALAARNERAPIHLSTRTEPACAILLPTASVTLPAAPPPPSLPGSRFRAAHAADVRSHCFRLAPVAPERVTQALRVVLAEHGERCWRIKGRVAEPGTGAVWLVQAVGTRLSPPERLDHAPADEQAGELVFITEGLATKALHATLSATGLVLAAAEKRG